ncbi:MAG TPA: MFS transporter [Bryobacteraceae bacterium]|nr:MFS transporter [Bryobacteraceae bacterium]
MLEKTVIPELEARTLNLPAKQKGGWTGPVVMLVATLISYIDRQTLAVLSPMILADTHLTAEDFSVVLSFFSISYMLANPVWGSVLDFVGLRIGMAIAVAVWTLASTSHAWVTGFIGFAIARTILGVGEGAVFPGCMKMSADCLPPIKQSRGTSLGYSGAAIGSLITPLLVTPFALKFGWRGAFWITGGLGAAWLIWWYFICRPPTVPIKPRVHPKISLPNLLDRRVWLIVTTYGTGAVALGVIAYLSPLYLSRALSLSQQKLGYVLWIPTLGWWIGYYFWGWFSDRIVPNDARPVWVLLMLSALALPVTFVTLFHSWQVAVAFFLWAMFVADGFIVMGLHVGARVFSKDQAGMAAGIGGGAWSMVLALILPVYGKWIDARHFLPIFVTMSLLPLFGTLIFIWLSRPWARPKQI